MEFDPPEESTGGFLSTEGAYHVSVLSINEDISEQYPWAQFEAVFEVLDGTAKGQEKKTTTQKFSRPSLKHKDEGQMAKEIIARFLLATGLMSPSQRGKTGQHFELSEAVGRQLVVKFVHGKDPKYLAINYSDLWHVDDPEVSGVPKSKAAVDTIPPEQRGVGAGAAVKGGQPKLDPAAL